MTDESEVKKVSLNIPFESTEVAKLAYNVLSVDEEFKGSGLRKELAVENNELVINYYGSDLKRLRVAVNGILKNLTLIIKTIDQFS